MGICRTVYGWWIERQRDVIRHLVKQVTVGEDKLVICVDWAALCERLSVRVKPTDEAILRLEFAASLTRSFIVISRIRLIIETRSPETSSSSACISPKILLTIA